LTGNWLIG